MSVTSFTQGFDISGGNGERGGRGGEGLRSEAVCFETDGSASCSCVQNYTLQSVHGETLQPRFHGMI